MNIPATADEIGVIILGIVMAAQIIGRAIPDDAKGLLGAVRVVAKTIGLYAGTNGNFTPRSFRDDPPADEVVHNDRLRS